MACFQGCGCGGRVAGCCGNNNGTAQNRCNLLGPIRAIDQECLPAVTARGGIIPFASGAVPVALTTIVGGLVGVPFFLGFGTAVPGAFVGDNIILPTTLGELLNEAFTVPRTGSITSISATFTIVAALTLAPTATVRAQIYRAAAGSDTFMPTTAFVDLAPTITTVLAVGTTLSGSAVTTPVPVTAGDRLLMVFTLTGTAVAAAVTGTASAGIAIAEA